MTPIFTLLAVVSLSLIVTRVATTALVLTGMSREASRFQARSAFTGVGYTTSETESVVNHPVRRRIVMVLMLLGNVGLVTLISTFMLSFIEKENTVPFWQRIMFLICGLVLLWGAAVSKWIDRYLTRLIEWSLRRFTTLDTRDYASLLRLTGDYGVAEVSVGADDWIAGKALLDAQLKEQGIQVLGIQRSGGGYVGAPQGSTRIEAGDTIIVYGMSQDVAALDCRSRSNGEPSPQQTPQELQA